MKKFFTLISVALMAMSANAQEVWKAAEYDLTQAKEEKLTQGIYGAGTADAPDTSVPGELVTSVITASTANVTMTGLSTPNSLSKKDVEEGKTQVYWELKGKPADDANPNDALVTDACNPKFAQYLMPKGNPGATHWEFYELNSDGDEVFRAYDTYWNPGDNMPAKGAYWKFETKAAGTLKLGVYVNKGNHLFYVVDAATKQPLAPASVNVAIYYQNTGFAYESQKDENGEVIPGTEKYLNEGVMADDYILQHTNGCTQNRPALGYVSFPVEAGKTYYVFNQKSQIGLYGFEFTAGAGGAGDSNAVFSWENNVVTGGTVVGNGSEAENVGASDSGNTVIKVSAKKANIATDNLTFTFDQALAAEDVMEITAYRKKDSDAVGTLYMQFENGYVIDEGEEQKWNNIHEAIGQQPNTNTYALTDAAGSKSMLMARSKASTNVFIIKMVINRGGSTGIGNIEVVAPQFNGAIYNLAGQKVGEDYKGIVIKNGKKFINK